ncbi:MAG: CBS domain-containing protein [Oscillospiraceae bacterium]|nr:CBS domain-containing protein [Oscillospiraceae bacterium]MBQ3879173.1 CBS domain-containing protein [Oscillospiraceae bacterium]
MDRTDQFLDLYKRLEDAAAARYGDDAGTISKLEHMQQYAPLAPALRSCREVRNLLQHNPKIDGSYPAEPSEKLIEVLDELLRRIENPPLAGDKAIRLKRIFRRPMSAPVLDTMREMAKRDLSKIPILEKERVVGVFSQESLFERALREGIPPLDESTKFSDLSDFLKIDPKYYRFAPFRARLDEIEAIFGEAYARHTRIRTIFLTENGRQSEKLLGLITPWEMI